MDRKAERAALLEEIRIAFRDVTRGGGVSWAQTEILDHYGLPPRGKPIYHDRDERWEDLVNDREWLPEPGVGGNGFLEPIGYRYYLPAAMTRCLRTGDVSEMDSWFGRNERQALLDDRQRKAVEWFVNFVGRSEEPRPPPPVDKPQKSRRGQARRRSR